MLSIPLSPNMEQETSALRAQLEEAHHTASRLAAEKQAATVSLSTTRDRLNAVENEREALSEEIGIIQERLNRLKQQQERDVVVSPCGKSCSVDCSCWSCFFYCLSGSSCQSTRQRSSFVFQFSDLLILNFLFVFCFRVWEGCLRKGIRGSVC